MVKKIGNENENIDRCITNNNSFKCKNNNNLNKSKANNYSNKCNNNNNLKRSKTINPNKSKKNNSIEKSKTIKNSNRQIENGSEYGTPEELQGIINSLLERKKFLEDTYGKKLYTHNNDLEKPKTLKDYQSIIDKLSKEVFELEIINNIWKNQNKYTQINFFLSSGQNYIINVDNETKLFDAFKKAVSNGQFNLERYTLNMNNKTQNTDACSNSTLSKEKFNNKHAIFLSGGKDVSEKFRKNEPVSSLNNGSNLPISILVDTV